MPVNVVMLVRVDCLPYLLIMENRKLDDWKTHSVKHRGKQPRKKDIM